MSFLKAFVMSAAGSFLLVSLVVAGVIFLSIDQPILAFFVVTIIPGLIVGGLHRLIGSR